MANGEQMKILIKEATEEIAQKGYGNVSDKTVNLAGFGFLADVIREYIQPQPQETLPSGGSWGSLVKYLGVGGVVPISLAVAAALFCKITGLL